MAEPIRVLAIHGMGGHERHPESWQPGWRATLERGLGGYTSRAVGVEFLAYDEVFSSFRLDFDDVAEALLRLGWNGISALAGDVFGRTRGIDNALTTARWTAGMVVQWVDDDGLREATRDVLRQAMEEKGPFDVVVAHSLGSLIAYDTFGRKDGRELIEDRFFVTLGSQLGNPFVRGGFSGVIRPLPACEFWYHLYNPRDHVFTAPLSVPAPNFRQVVLGLSLPGPFAEHAAVHYLSDTSVAETVWRDVAVSRPGPGRPRGAQGFPAVARSALGKQPQRRALLCGVNTYQELEGAPLEGCVNDVYAMSAVLQEAGYAADDIRVVVNDRATTSAIKERLEWLLGGVQPGQERVFAFSGHGSQIPSYDADDEVDGADECLCPCDFDWSPDRAITDDWFSALYGQLPYEAEFVAVVDACYSGGIARSGARRVRGLDPPDDIRHRALRWDADERAWVSRKAEPWNAEFGLPGRLAKRKGFPRHLRRLGYGTHLRTLSTDDGRRNALRQAFGTKGPYMPLLLEACREQELANEYQHGPTTYGAFTYFLVQRWRLARKKGRTPTFADLMKEVLQNVLTLFPQRPQIEGPLVRRNAPAFAPAPAGGQRAARGVKATRPPTRGASRRKSPPRSRRRRR